MSEPKLVVAVAGPAESWYTGDGEWFADCPRCESTLMGFSKGEAERLATEHACQGRTA